MDQHLFYQLFSAPVQTIGGTKWGYMNLYGQFVIPPQFTYAYEFEKNGVARVQFEDFYGTINKMGQFVIDPIYSFISEFNEGLASAAKGDDGYIVINEEGKIITSKSYSYIGSYHDGRALASVTNETKTAYGFLDREGNEVIPLIYENGFDFKNGKTVVQIQENEFSLINVNGDKLQTYSYANVGAPSEGLLSFKKDPNGQFGYIDEKGTIIIPPTFIFAFPFQNGVAEVNISSDYSNKYGLINRKGEYLIKPVYNDMILLGENRVALGKAIEEDKPYIGSTYAIADLNGKLLTDFLYESVLEYDRGVASVHNHLFTFFINKYGQLATGLPIVKGQGTLSFIGSVIQANVDQRISYYYPNGVRFWKQNTIIPLRPPYQVIEKKYKPDRNYLVYYPQLKGMENLQALHRVNQELKNRSEVREVTPKELKERSYTGDFSIVFFKKNLLVLKLEGYVFPFGAAHGMPSRNYPHINIETGRFYKLEDLFKPDSNYVEVISEIIKQQINEQTEEGSMYYFPDAYKGIRPDQPFYVTGDALNIYFEPYEIAAYAAGFPTFTIPFTDIMNLINMNGSFWRSFHS